MTAILSQHSKMFTSCVTSDPQSSDSPTTINKMYRCIEHRQLKNKADRQTQRQPALVIWVAVLLKKKKSSGGVFCLSLFQSYIHVLLIEKG